MAISTIDGVYSGMQIACDFCKFRTGSLTAPYPFSLLYTGGTPSALYEGDLSYLIPKNYPIVSSTIAYPTTIRVIGHPWVTGSYVSISGHVGSTPNIDGIYQITWLGDDTFTIPVNVTVAGTSGVACGMLDTNAPGLKGMQVTRLYGNFPFVNPPVGKNTYLARLQAMASLPGTLLLCDRLWHNGGISPIKSTVQVFSDSDQILPRDNNGTGYGVGVYAAIEISSTSGTGGTTPTITLSYTNSEGVPGKACTNLMPTGSLQVGTFLPMKLAAGDVGIQKAESITLSTSWLSGNIHVVLYRVLARLELPTAYITNAIDAIASGFPMLYNDTVPFLVFLPDASGLEAQISGHIIYTQG